MPVREYLLLEDDDGVLLLEDGDILQIGEDLNMNRTQAILLERGTVVRRRALNSPLKQGSAETVRYVVDFTPWGASDSYPVSTPVVTVLDQDDASATSTVFSADDATVISNVEGEFTLSAVTAGDRYRVFVKGTIDGLIGQCWVYVDGEL